MGGEDEHAEHAVGAVDEGEALLLLQDDRGDARLGERLGGGLAHAVGGAHLALAHDGQRAVREGARSPEQPSEPYSWTTGVIPAFSSAAYACAVSVRTPVRPVARVDRRSSISARTTSRSTSGPEPAACERTRLRWSWARSSVGMCRVASAPKPVETP